jgi:hypothetical protein
MASGINSTFRQVGIATGTAALGALFQHILSSDATGPLARVPTEVLAQGRPPLPGQGAREAYLTLFTDGLNDILLVAKIVTFAGAVLSFALIRGRDFIAAQGGDAAPSEAEPELTAAAS